MLFDEQLLLIVEYLCRIPPILFCRKPGGEGCFLLKSVSLFVAGVLGGVRERGSNAHLCICVFYFNQIKV